MAKKLNEDQIKWILSLDASEAEKGVNELTKKNTELTNRNKELRKSMQHLEIQGKKNSAAYLTLSEEYSKNTKQISSNREMMKRLDEQMGLNNLSMTQLKRRAQDLQKQLDTTSQALHPQEWEQLNQQLTATRTRMNELKDSGKAVESQFQQAAKSAGKWSAFFGNLYMRITDWGIQTLGKLKDITAEGIEMAASADGVQRAFERLDDGQILNNLRKATKGTVTDLDLMKATVQAKDFRIPLEDLGKYLQFAQLKAQQTGQSVDYLTSSIITGLGRQSVMILDNLGLSAAEINEQVSQTGDFMSAVALIIDKQLAAAGDNYVSSSDRAQAATVRFQNAQRELGETLLPLKENWDELYTGMSIGTMELIGWIVKHRNVLVTLVAAYSSYKIAKELATTATYKEMTATKASILLDKLKLAWINNTKGATLLYAAAKAKLTGNTKRAAAAMRLFNTTCKASVIGLLASLVTAAAVAFFTYRNRVSAASEVTKEANQSISEEKNQLESLKKVLFDSSKSYQERKYALDEIQKIVPGYHASLTKEGKLINNNAKALDGYVEKLLITAKQQAANTKLQEALNARTEWIGNNKSMARKAMGIQMAMGDPLNAGKGLDAVAAEQGVIPAAYKAFMEQKKLLDNQVKLYEDMMKGYVQQLANIDAKYTKPDTDTPNSVDLVEAKKKEIEDAEKVVASTKEEVIARNQKVAALKAELDALQNLGIQKKKDNSTEKAHAAAEKEQKARIATEQAAVKSLETLREEDLQSQQKWYNDSLSALTTAQSTGRMTKEQYEMMLLELEKQNADTRLRIERSYYSDAQSMALMNANIKEDIVRKSNQRVIDAEKSANATRASQQEALNNLVKSFKDQFKLTTVDEDYTIQLKTLEAAYQARKEMAEKNNLDATELDKAYFRAKEQLESEHLQKILAIRNQYGLSTQQERFNAELEQLRLAREQQLLTEKEYEQAVQNLKRDSYKKQFDYYSNLFSGAIQALQQAEMDNIDAKYDAEIEAAKGDAEEIERLENEKAQKKLDVQKKYADVNFAIKASQIIADTAVSIMKAYADLGPIAGSIAAALMGVTGAAQLASAKAERDKVKNMTLSGSSSNSVGTGARVATGRQSGGKIDVRRAQDGKLFSGVDYDPDARGFIDHPTVIVGEGPVGQSKEWVASNAAVSNPTVAPILDILDKSQQAGTIRTLDLNQVIRTHMAGYSSGGPINTPISVSSNSDQSGTIFPPDLMRRFANAIVRLDEEGLPPAPVLLSEIERKQELRNRSRAIGSKK